MLASNLELLAKRKEIAKKKGTQTTRSHPTLIPGDYGAKSSSNDTNFYNVSLLFISECLELIHCFSELNFAC